MTAVHRRVLLGVDMSSAPPIRVVCAVIQDAQGRVLLAQRPAHKHLGLKWEFAGGKVEAGESTASALMREIREELGCDIVISHATQQAQEKFRAAETEFLGKLKVKGRQQEEAVYRVLGLRAPG